MLNLHANNVHVSKEEFNKILPIFSYSVATFFLMDFAFFINDIVYTLHFTYIESFILLGIPFIGRMVTPFIYSYVGRLGVPRLALLSITLMAVISFGMGYETTFIELFASRFIIGIFFGLATSAAIEVSSITGNRKIIGFTMGGWAIGWLMGAIFFMLLGSWELVSIAGIVFAPAVLFSRKHNVISPMLKKFHFDFSIKVFLVFLLGFTPAYVLEIVPSYLGPSAFIESIVAYSIAVFAYLLLPAMMIRFSLKKTLFSSLIIVAISGILFFSTTNIAFAVVFTMFGLGVNSLLPIISKNLNVEADKIGPSMNFSAVAGFIFPVILTMGNEALNSALAVFIASMFLMLFISVEFGKHGYKSINIKKFLINH